MQVNAAGKEKEGFMKKLIQSEKSKAFITVIATISCLALSPIAQAVVPAPGGGYPGGNTAEGQNALFSLTTGGFNTAVGYLSLRSDTTGSFNTAVGAGTLLANTGNENTATGVGALLSNTSGDRNTATGAVALLSDTSGHDNTSTGVEALYHNTNGNDNTASGVDVLFSNTHGDENTATGHSALFSNTTGHDNTSCGFSSMLDNIGGSFNTAIGQAALLSNTSGDSNTAIGNVALAFNTNGSGNIALGDGAGASVTTANNVIAIGTAGNDVSDSCYIGNIFGATSSNGIGVFVNSNGRLGTMTSSQRFKEEIKAMDQTSEVLYDLRPVTFRYKKEIDPDAKSQFGLVAEDVEKVNPNLVVRDKEGKPYSVRYDQVNAMLLNEFLKEHRKVEAQARKMDAQEHKIREHEATISELKKDLQTVVARLKDQDSKIRRVTAELEMSKRSPHVVATNP